MNDSPFIFTVDESNFTKLVIEASQRQPVLVDFWAEWCAPCRLLAPTIDELAQQYQGKVKIGKLDTDANRDVAMKHQISMIPTIILYKGGEVVKKITGVTPKKELASELEALLA